MSRSPKGSSIAVEIPERAGQDQPRFGSDVVALTLRDMGMRYIALTPGASFRGLHDSLVNLLGNRDPAMLVCLHEEHAVAIAHGYAKVTGRAIGAALHSNVGLMHATMAIYNAWCDRMPVLVIGATGPVDAARRRPWIDWIHTSADQGALVRPYVKWDDQPGSATAAVESLLRAGWLAESAPKAPVYVNLDSSLQEDAATLPEGGISARRFLTAADTGPSPNALDATAAALAAAERPVILAGRASRDPQDWLARVALARGTGAKVVTDIRVAAAFPTTDPAYLGDLRGAASAGVASAIRQADVLLALDWVDLKGTLDAVFGPDVPSGKIIRVTLDHTIHNGWSMDHQGHPPADLVVACDPDRLVSALVERMDLPPVGARDSAGREAPVTSAEPGPMVVGDVARALREVTHGKRVTLTHVPLSWQGDDWALEHPLDHLGSDGGGGVGAGPGNAVGAALALRDEHPDRLPVAVCGDGDFLMGCTALWTAVHYGIPLLMIVVNNQSFYNDEVHQERVARSRERPPENKWIGMRLTDPEIDLTAIAEAQGCKTQPRVSDGADLRPALDRALAKVDAGHVAYLEVVIQRGYPEGLKGALGSKPSGG